MEKHKKWIDYPIRFCRSFHKCVLCEEAIYLGQNYYDGGYGRRVHINCGRIAVKKENPDEIYGDFAVPLCEN